MLDLSGKRVLVIGGTGGIGEKLCEQLKLAGASCISTSRGDCDSGKLKLDLSCTKSIELFLNIIGTMECFDAVIVNAAANFPAPIWSIEDEKLDYLFRVNTLSPIKIMRDIASRMKKAGNGKVVFVSSISSIVTRECSAVYAASKGAINAYMRAAALDLSSSNILVNAVLPGPIKTKMTEKVLTVEQIEQLSKAIPMNRMADPVEIVNVIIFLISDMNSYITGQTIVVDGGLTIKQVN